MGEGELNAYDGGGKQLQGKFLNRPACYNARPDPVNHFQGTGTAIINNQGGHHIQP